MPVRRRGCLGPVPCSETLVLPAWHQSLRTVTLTCSFTEFEKCLLEAYVSGCCLSTGDAAKEAKPALKWS